MFEQTFVEAAQSKKPASLIFSLALQGAVVFLLVLLPLLYTQVLPGAAMKTFLLAPMPPRAVFPEPPPPIEKAAARLFDGRRLFAPTVIPKQVASSAPAAPVPDIGVAGSIGDAGSTSVSGVMNLLNLIPQAPPPPPIARPNAKPARQPVAVGGRVAEANLLRKVMPAYPPMARSVRVQGTVEFTALISREGAIENLQLVHGHPLLVGAAKEAVLQWKYRPTLLNGEPVEVVTDIVVNFTLAQ